MSKQDLCHRERIEQFLGQQLPPEEQATFELHLERCESCREELEKNAASDAVWMGVRESLLEEPPTSDLGPGSATQEDLTFSHDSVLKLLAPSDDDRMIGRLGTYEVMGVIGSGGMGIVLKAFDAALNRYVAIKVLAPHLGNSGAARQRFSRESQAAAAVVHDNVIEIHGVADTDGLPYLVMPYLRGPSLQKRLDEAGTLTLVEILRIGMQAASGLAAAHAQGLVHRDVKPANILLADGVERVKLTDFGLARAADDVSLTMTGVIAGTPQYMSPEQACGESIDQRSDLFSLGSVLYAMCTGRAPFRAETSLGVLRRITDDEPQPIREINADIPDWLCQIVAKLMSKQRDDRFESAEEVAELLEQCLAHVQQPTTVPLPASLTASRTHWLFRSRRTGVLTMLGFLSSAFMGMFFLQATTAPDIAGKWNGEGWGIVELVQAEKSGRYTGTYDDTLGDDQGKLKLQWSRIERRYNGHWSEGDKRFGKLSLRLVDQEIRGGWTTSKEAKINPGTPELADLQWQRSGNTAPMTRLHTSPQAKQEQPIPVYNRISLAWQQSEPYQPPNFEAFFPDDIVGGLALDDLFNDEDRDSRSDEVILNTVQQGLRRTSEHRTLILSWIGNKYIWNKSPQKPEAIEIMYHAVDFSGKRADPYGTRHYAVYFGLSVTQPKTPAILRTLAELCMRVDDPNDLGRVAWGAKNQQQELLTYLKPFLDSEDEAVRTKAQTCQKIFTGEVKAFEWAAEQARLHKQPSKRYEPAASRFPYAVKFEQGATKFEAGDDIAILEIHGSAKNFQPGNLYRIKGTYKLASHDKALLAAYTTATNAKDGVSRSLKIQHLNVDRGEGTFTLYLPMSYEGWPHVSFYDKNDGKGFGGNYFGTGDFVLEQWWGAQPTGAQPTKPGTTKPEPTTNRRR